LTEPDACSSIVGSIWKTVTLPTIMERYWSSARADYAKALQKLRQELGDIRIHGQDAAERTRRALDGTLRDLASLP
jgi:hypothetical protein